ncbi:LTA synthase family protein [Caldibacillus lycopersici]|uniref:LTA synthase family protein n=1 Tax=Perspicuibacillus lycopersici TaxID=1325689 RepID=A0AAE3IUH5_9BACI|nr:LTA synthase family protein [Perspicuibacillus lycopersici]MCU9614746.1 LTA synthase family protein [Perspicuibacillus lycopersici]
MTNNIRKGQSFSNKYFSFFFLAVLFLWIKTYIIQLTQFDLGVEGFLQNFLLFINPLGSALIFLGITFLFKGRKRYISLIIIDFILSLLLFANAVYYRFFNDFITLPTILQTQNFGDVSTSVPSLLHPTDFLFFIDLLILIALLMFKVVKVDRSTFTRRKLAAVYLIGLSISFLNLGLAEGDRPQLLTRGFDRNYIVKYLGMYNYTIYDAVESTKASAQRVFADSNDITEVINYTKSNYAAPNVEYFGKLKGKNVVYLHLESMQNFLIDYKLNGEEVTPFLNSLVKDSNTLYFDNFFHQTAQGKTADAEFLLENSLYGLPQGAAFITKSRNVYQSAPAILAQEQGYTSAVFHGNAGSFWNRNTIYKSFGYENFFDANYYNINDNDLAEYGLMDKPFFDQSVELLETLPQPFYTKFITVANHYPYKIDQSLTTIEKHSTGDASVDNYFQTARYADEALEQFFNDLKEAGLYENTVFVMYGDHYGISEAHNNAMEKVMNEEIGSYESANLQRVPFIIHSPGLEGGTVHTYGGQVDVLPTVLHLLGVDTSKYLQFGSDLLSPNHDELVIFRNGEFMSPKYDYLDGKYFDNTTGLVLEDEAKIQEAKELREKAEYELLLSDKVVNGDLLRFYTPDGFTPVDASAYNYSKDAEDDSANE